MGLFAGQQPLANIPRFNGAHQNVNGRAKIRTLPDEGGTVGNELDLTSLYPEVQSMRRRVRLLPDRSVSFEDKWETGAGAVEYAFQWMTTADMMLISQGLHLIEAGQTMTLFIPSPHDCQIEIEDVSLLENLQDSPSPGLRRLLIRKQTVAYETGHFQITAMPDSMHSALSSGFATGLYLPQFYVKTFCLTKIALSVIIRPTLIYH